MRFLMQREATYDFVEDLISDEPNSIGEVSAIVEQLTESFQELSQSLRKPNSTQSHPSFLNRNLTHGLFLFPWHSPARGQGEA